jgi:hypothetical protein
MKKCLAPLLALPLLGLPMADALAFGISHHGGLILDCEAPIFFDEAPAKESKVPSFREFSVVASENTDPETVKVWVNNEPIAVKLTPQRSGRLAIQGSTKEPITAGKAWIKVTAVSHDGCDQLHVWNVYVGQ